MIIYYIGKIFGKRFKKWYHRKYGVWHWGIYSFVNDGENPRKAKKNFNQYMRMLK